MGMSAGSRGASTLVGEALMLGAGNWSETFRLTRPNILEQIEDCIRTLNELPRRDVSAELSDYLIDEAIRHRQFDVLPIIRNEMPSWVWGKRIADCADSLSFLGPDWRRLIEYALYGDERDKHLVASIISHAREPEDYSAFVINLVEIFRQWQRVPALCRWIARSTVEQRCSLARIEQVYDPEVDWFYKFEIELLRAAFLDQVSESDSGNVLIQDTQAYLRLRNMIGLIALGRSRNEGGPSASSVHSSP